MISTVWNEGNVWGSCETQIIHQRLSFKHTNFGTGGPAESF